MSAPPPSAVRSAASALLLAGAFLATGVCLDGLLALGPIDCPRLVGLFPAALGAALWVAAARALAPPARSSATPGGGPRPLVETGPYLAVRHPQLVGALLVVAGASLALRSPGCLLVTGPLLLLAWLGWALLREEPALRRRYGAAWARYRADTGLVVPSFLASVRMLACAAARLGFGLRVRGAGRVPRSGAFLLVGLHRSYLDPPVVALALGRAARFLAAESLFRRPLPSLVLRRLGCIPLRRYRPDRSATRRAFEVLGSGGVLCLFPEGGRSWAGETVCDPAIFRLLERPGLPIVTADVEGAWESWPRFGRLPRPRRLLVRYRLHAPAAAAGRPTGVAAEEIVRGMVERERVHDRRLARTGSPLSARGIEAVLSACPACGEPYTLSGRKDGAVRCRACGARSTLVAGKALRLSDGRLLPLVAAWDAGARRASGRAPELREFRGLLRILEPDGTPRSAPTPATLGIQAERLELRGAPGLSRAVSWARVDAVLIQGVRHLELLCRGETGPGEILRFTASRRHALSLEQAVRARAFGDVISRRRGSPRRRVEPRPTPPSRP